MKTLGNILWHFPFFGFITSLFTAILGLFFLATIVGIPIGLGLLQHSKFLLTPFSSRMIPDSKTGDKGILDFVNKTLKFEASQFE